MLLAEKARRQAERHCRDLFMEEGKKTRMGGCPKGTVASKHKDQELAFSVKYFLLGISYIGSSICCIWQKLSFSNPALDFVTLAALWDE